MESAPGKSGSPRAARFAVALCFVLNGGLFASWVTRIPAIQAQLGMSHAVLGLVLLSTSVGALLAMPLTGFWITRFGSRRVGQGMTILYCASVPWLALAGTPWLLALALFIYGAAYGGMDVAMNAQAVAVEERYGRPIMGSFHALYSLGGLAGAAAGGAIAKNGFPPSQHFTGVVLTFGLLSLFLALPRLLPTPMSPPSITAHRRGFVVPPPSLLAIGAIAFCTMMAEGSVADWGAIYLNREVHLDEGTAAWGFAAFSITMASARLFGDRVAARLGTVRLVRLGGCIAAAGLACALAFSHPIAVLAGFAGMGIGLAPIIPLAFSAAGRTPGMEAGPALAVTTTIGYTGFLLGPPLIGFIAEASSLRQALWLIVAMSVGVALLATSAEPRKEW